MKVGITDGLHADFTTTPTLRRSRRRAAGKPTRFSVLFPEKRDFFLEGQGIFAFGGSPTVRRHAVRLRQSAASRCARGDVLQPANRPGRRQGMPIDVGRTTGKAGHYSLGFIDIRTSEGTTAQPRGHQLRRRAGEARHSAPPVGVPYTDRSSTLFDLAASLAGVDGVFSFYQNLNINTYLAASDNPGVERRQSELPRTARLQRGQVRSAAGTPRPAEELRARCRLYASPGLARNTAYARYSPRPHSAIRKRCITRAASTTSPIRRIACSRAPVSKPYGLRLQNGDQVALEPAQNYERLDKEFEVPGVKIPDRRFSRSARFICSTTRGHSVRCRRTSPSSTGQFYNGTRTGIAPAVDACRSICESPSNLASR